VVVVAGGGEGNGGKVDDMIICLMKPFEIIWRDASTNALIRW
jgi:hypothetical protein